MKSTCVPLRFTRSTSSSPTANGKPLPSAMWLAAFSSSSVSKNTVSSGPIRPSPSTSASSPSRVAPSSIATGPQRLRVLVGGDLDRAAALEAHAQATDDRPVAQHERLRRGHHPVRPLRIGRREHLLGRQVRDVAQPVGSVEVRAPPGVGPEHADAQLGAGAAQLDRVELARAQPVGGGSQRRHPLLPRLGGIGLVQPQDVLELAPQRLERLVLLQFGMDQLRPGRVRARDDAPVRRPLADDLRDLAEIREVVAPGECRVEPVEQVRRGRAGRRDPRPTLVGVRDHPPPYHDGTKPSVSGSADSILARLTCGSKYQTSTNARRGRRPRRRWRARAARGRARRSRARLSRLHVGAVHGEPGERLKAGGVHREAILPPARTSRQ